MKGKEIVPIALGFGVGWLILSNIGGRVDKNIVNLEWTFTKMKMPSFSLENVSIPITLTALNTRNDAVGFDQFVGKVYLVRNGVPLYLGSITTPPTSKVLIQPRGETEIQLAIKVVNTQLFKAIPDFISKDALKGLKLTVDGYAHAGGWQFPVKQTYNLS